MSLAVLVLAGVAPGGNDDTGLGASARTALDAAEAVVGGMLVVLGAVAPVLVVALLAWPIVRWVGRRRPGEAPAAGS